MPPNARASQATLLSPPALISAKAKAALPHKSLDHVTVEPHTYDTAAWQELYRLAQQAPELFWTMYLPKLTTAPQPAPVDNPPDLINTSVTHKKYSTTINGEIIKRTQRIRVDKLAANADLKAYRKEQAKKAKTDREQWYATKEGPHPHSQASATRPI